MLNVVALRNGRYLISSVALGIEEYYLGVGEAPGTWDGGWAGRLGLAGEVGADELSRLIEGHDPGTGGDLVAGLRERKVKAFDLTFSAPKSVSLLWAFATVPTARAVRDAHDEAVSVALGFLEEHAAAARQQVGGLRTRVPTKGWAVARFVHRTSREGDPQLHTHCLVPNLVERVGDGRHVALDSNLVYGWARAAGSLYQNHLQRVLTSELGVAWGPDRHNTREIAGFSRAQLRLFSKRSAQIEAELEAAGADYEAPGLRMRADEAASLATRVDKDRALTPANLVGRWLTEAGAAGVAVGAALEGDVLRVALRSQVAGWSWGDVVAHLVDEEKGVCAHSPRFTEADIIEHLCALSGGAWSTEEVLAMASQFLTSEHAVRLTPPAELGQPGRRRPPQWSTAVHRALEDDTLSVLRDLLERPAKGAGHDAVETVLALAPELGDDQAEAVRVLCGAGGSVRAALSPAGFGKTAMVHVAASALTTDKRIVLGVATTAKAVAELEGAGLVAMTIARLRIALADRPLAPGTAVVVDELSQTSTRDANTVLHAVADCPGSVLIVLGDPRQAPSVKAGGVAAEIAELVAAHRIPAADLTVNRRQVNPVDQAALAALRAGRPAESQAVRAEHGWEHEHTSPTEARDALADAAVADMAAYGTAQVAVLAVSHTDAEDLADRLRHRLLAAGAIGGATLAGPGWATDRTYQAGDRVLLHARCAPRDPHLVNGTTATVATVDPGGLDLVLDNGRRGRLPVDFVQGHKRDGSPNLSHAWARTIDGAQGGTWEICHLLGTSSLDAFRGYTGQSRSRQPTHTWNTLPAVTTDHGGLLADERTAAERVVAALAREPDPTMAARSDPWTRDRELRAQIAEHQTALASQPPDRNAALQQAARVLTEAERDADAALRRLVSIDERIDALGPLAGVTPRGRRDRERLHRDHNIAVHDLHHADTAQGQARQHHAAVVAEQRAHEQFVDANRWRHADLPRLHAELDRHWASVVLACTQAGEPLAFGIEPLRRARRTVVAELDTLREQAPRDRRGDLHHANAACRDAASRVERARQRLGSAEQTLADAARRRVGPIGHKTVTLAEERVSDLQADLRRETEGAQRAEADLERVRQHEAHRARVLTVTGPQQAELTRSLRDLDTALDATRPARVLELLASPDAETTDLLGAPPPTAAGAAAWCHYALAVETVRDHEPPTHERAWKLMQRCANVGPTIALADAANLDLSGTAVDPDIWAQCATRAGALASSDQRHVHSPLLTRVARNDAELDFGL